MRWLSFAGAAVTGLGLILATAPTNASTANAPMQLSRDAVTRTHASALRASRRHRTDSGPTPCSTNYPTSGESFVGVQYYPNDVAGGMLSAVLGGESNLACDTDTAIGAGFSNMIGNGSTSEAVDSFVGAGFDSVIFGAYSFIGAGSNNEINPLANPLLTESFIGAGEGNLVTGESSFIGAGGNISDQVPGNQVSGEDSFIGAGDQNILGANESFIGSGGENSLSANATASFIGAGQSNKVTSTAADAVIAGGAENEVTGQKATVGGGELNGAEASFATVPGGYHNLAAGNESFAAGSQAEAFNTGSFVWSDYVSGEKPLNDGAADQFVVRASGGMYVYSNAKSPYTGVKLSPGSGTWASVSDRNAKTDIAPLDDATVLAKVANLPVSIWRYKTESGVRHVGPMAQDFYAAFGVGEDDRHITSIDEDGVALAAIKALHREVGTLHGENALLKSKFASIETKYTALERRLDEIASRTRP